MKRNWWKRLSVETLEDRVLLSASPVLPEPLMDSNTEVSPLSVLPQGQRIFLDLDGAANVDYDGPLTVSGINVPAFRIPELFAGQEAAIQAGLLASLNASFAEQGVVFTTVQQDEPYSTIYIGGRGEPFGPYGLYLGLAEQVDLGNQDPTDEAFVFSDLIGISAPTPREYLKQLAAIVGHEAAHLLGSEHEHHDSSIDPLAKVAFKVPTHIEIAKDVRADLLEDGMLTIDGGEYRVHPKILEAIQNYPAYYFGGTVGPDTFPDIVYGQGTIHPIDTGTWLQRVLDMAWAAQTDASYSPEERSQILAWSYGFLTHAAGDIWAHTLFNEFSEGVFPPFTTLLTNERNFANAARHFLAESYVADATPNGDNVSDRSLLPDGDISDDSSSGSFYAAPHRFVYETLIKPFPGEPSSGRGPLINNFLSIRANLAAQASALGPRPDENFQDLLRSVFEQLQQGEVPQTTLDTLYRSYLYNWIDDIDNGLRNWNELGLAIANGLTDAQSRRDLQNSLGSVQGSEFDVKREGTEGEVGLADVLLHELDDPNNDGNFSDSFLNQYYFPMIGIPREFTQFRAALQSFGGALQREIVGPLRSVFNPIIEQIDKLKEIPKELVENFIEERFGFDIDTLELLTDLGSKMDLASISVGGTTIPLFKSDAHEKLDAIMGIRGIEQSPPLPETLASIPGVIFHSGATDQLNPNVEFDKSRFAAYANAVTLAKLVLLMEAPPDRETTGAGELSRFFSDQLGRPYDFSLLNLNGGHGGNILTTTLPRPGERVPVIVDGHVLGEADSDSRPGIVSIDTDHGWRTDSQTRRTENYRVHSAGVGDNRAVWTFKDLDRGEYTIQTSWLANLKLSPASNATFRLFDGERLLAEVTVNQLLFADDFGDAETGLLFENLGSFRIESGTLSIDLSDAADGDVIAGPIRVVPADGSKPALVLRPERDESGEVLSREDGYFEKGDWADLKYATSTGNFPLWESKLLRPVFRAIFTDWENGSENFPDLGDETSPDPNDDPDIRSNPLGSLASPFGPRPDESLPEGEDLIVSGDVIKAVTGDYILGRVKGDGVGVLDTFTLRVEGEVLLTEDVGGGGLFNVVIEATKGIRVAPGVTISSRQFVGDVQTGASTANSGSVQFNAPSISIGQGARMLAHATGQFQAGNVTLAASVSEAIDWAPGIENFQIALSRATIDVGPDVVITGNNLVITTFASTEKTVDLQIDLLPGIEDQLAALIDEIDLFPFEVSAAAVFSQSESRITIGEGARLSALGDVRLDSQAEAVARIETHGRYLGVTYGSANPTAIVRVQNGARITAGDEVIVYAGGTTDLDVQTFVPGQGDVGNITFSYGKTRNTSLARIDPGANIDANAVTIQAENTNSVSNQAFASGYLNSGTAGIGATAVLGSYSSSATANVAGNITTRESLVVDAHSINTLNRTQGSASVNSPIQQSAHVQALNDLLSDIELKQDIGGETIQAISPTGPDFGLAGSVVIVESDNRAAALIDDGASIVSDNDVSVSSRAEDPFQVASLSSAGDALTASIGGAVAVSKVGNQATSFIGYNAFVDIGRTLHLDAKALVPNAATPLDPALAVPSPEATSSFGRIQEEYDNGTALGIAVDSTLAPLAAVVDAAAPTATSDVQAGGVPGQGQIGVSGGVNYLEIHNVGVAGIAAGARVNQREGNPATQDVRIDAEGTLETVHLAGQTSGQGIRPGSGRFSTPAASVGGFFNGIILNNEVRSYIDDRAEVNAGRDVSLHAIANNQILAAGQGGGLGADIAVDGAVNFIDLASVSEAYIEDRARVEAGNNITVDADTLTLAVNVAGGMVQGREAGIGASAAITRIENTTQAFIGNAGGAMAPGGTGGELGFIQAGNSLNLDAQARQEIWSVATAGAESPGSVRGIGGLNEFQALQFGFGISGDVAFNDLKSETQAFIRDMDQVAAGAGVQVTAADSTELTAGAGAIVAGNHTGIGGSFARNGVSHQTRAFTQNTNIGSQSLTLQATTDDQIVAVSNGGSGATVGAAVAGSVNLNKLENVTEAVFGLGTTAIIGGGVLLDARDDTVLHSAAGSSSVGTQGFLAVGAALDIGYLDKTANALLADRTTLSAAGDVNVLAAATDDLHSVSSSEAAANASGDPTRLYTNNGTASPFQSATGQPVGDEDQRVTSVALGDIDKDGDIDLVTGNFAQFSKVYRNDGTGLFEAPQNLGIDPGGIVFGDDGTFRERLANSLIPGLTMAITLADVNGDDCLDAIAGNLGQANRVYLNDGKGNFLPAFELGRFDLTVSLPLSTTNGNATAEDFQADLAAAIASALTLAGLNPADVTITLDANGVVTLESASRVLDAREAEAVIAGARRDFVIDTGLITFRPVALQYDGKDVVALVTESSTLDNRTIGDLVRDIQDAVDTGLINTGNGQAGDILVRAVDGRIVFTLPPRTLDSASAESAIEAARSGNKLIAPAQGLPVLFTLTYDGINLTVSVKPVDTNNNQTPEHLREDIQSAVDLAVAEARVGDRGTILVRTDTSGRIHFELPTHILDSSDAEESVARSRRAGRMQTADGGPLTFTLHFSERDLTRAIATGDLNGDEHIDIVAGNLNGTNRVYFNDGTGLFGPGYDISPEVGFTTTVVLGDVDGDDDLDLIAAGVNIDLGALVDQGLISAQDFVEGTVIQVQDLVQSGLVSLADLVRENLLNRFDFDSLADVNPADLVGAGIAALDELVVAGLVALEDFLDIPLPAADLIASGIVTEAELIANNLIDSLDNVSMYDLVQSGVVFLEEVLGFDLANVDNLVPTDLTLGQLLGAGLVELNELIDAGLIGVADLVRDRLNLRTLIDSGLVKLQDLVEGSFLDPANLNLDKLSIETLTAGLKAGGPTRLYRNDGTGRFDAGTVITTDQGVTSSVVLGDIDGDGDDDLVAGKIGTRNRFYLNDGQGIFSAGQDVSADVAATQQVLLADLDGDNDSDLLVANLGQPNRVYLNTGGVFAPGSTLGNESEFTTALAADDLNGDDKLDVIAGNSKPAVGVAGAVTNLELSHTLLAHVGDDVTLTTPQTLRVDTDDRTTVAMIVGAAASGTRVGAGLSGGRLVIDRDEEASIGSADITAQGISTRGIDLTGVIVAATATEDLLTYAAGQAESDDLGVAASLVVSSIDSRVESEIGSGTRINEYDTGAAAQDVVVRAMHSTTSLGAVGSQPNAGVTGIGAAASVGFLGKQVLASIAPSALARANDTIQVEAASVDKLTVAAAAHTTSGIIGIAGAVALISPVIETRASLAGDIETDGNAIVTADREASYLVGAGSRSVSGVAGAGASLAAVAGSVTTEASADSGATIITQGNTSATQVELGQKDGSGTEITRQVRGLWIGAVSTESPILDATGGSGAGLAGVAGSLTFAALNETTRALLGNGVHVNDGLMNSSAVHIDQSVAAWAFSRTDLIAHAGALAGGGLVGAGAGVDLMALVKTTEASLLGVIEARRDVEALAVSEEDLKSLTGTAGLGLVTAFGAAADVRTLDLTTRAFVAANARIRARSNVHVSADDSTEIDQITRGGEVAAGIAGGAAVNAVVIERTTEAFIGEAADVIALGQGPGVIARDGSFLVSFGPDVTAGDELGVPGIINSIQDLLTLILDNPIRFDIGEVVGDMLGDTAGEVVASILDLTVVGAPPPDDSYSQQRNARTGTRFIRGVAVSATARDDIETLAVGGAASVLGVVELSGVGVVTSNRTSAYIDNNSKVNTNPAGANALQSVLVGAGTDTAVMGITGVGTASTQGARGPSGSLVLIDNITEAFVETGADVRALSNVDVLANSSQDFLLASAGLSFSVNVGLTGSFPILSLNSRTSAFVNDASKVEANGSVNLSARDVTDADLLAGAGALGLSNGIGVSLGLAVIDKDTGAWIGTGATVDGRANAGSIEVFGPSVEEEGFETQTISGVAVQAFSSEEIVNAAAGAALSGNAGIRLGRAGAIPVVLVDSDTVAFIGEGARVNQTAGANVAQSVNVSAVNNSHILDVGFTRVGGAFTLAAGIDVQLVRNDTSATIEDNALVNAMRDVDVQALSQKKSESFVAGGGNTGIVGLVASLSLVSLRADFNVPFFDGFGITIDPLSHLNNLTDAGSVQQYIDEEVLAFTGRAGNGLGNLLDGLGEALGPVGDTAAEAIEASAPVSAATDTLEAFDPGTGNTAIIKGAVVHAGRDVHVAAREKLTSVLDTSFTSHGGPDSSILPYSDNRVILTTAAHAIAGIQDGADVEAGEDVSVTANIDETAILTGTTTLNHMAGTANAFIDSSTVIAALGDVSVSAAALTRSTYSAVLPGLGDGGSSSKSAGNKVRSTIDAHISGSTVTAANDVTVQATDDTVLSTIANATTLRGSVLNFVAYGYSSADNDLASTVTAYVEDSEVTATTGDVGIDALSTPTVVVIAVGIALTDDNIAIGASNARNLIAGTVDAHASNNAILIAGSDVRIGALNQPQLTAAAGSGAGNRGFGSGGGALAQNTITSTVTAFLDDATASGDNVSILADSTDFIWAGAGAGAGSETGTLAGSAAFNDIRPTVDAHVSNGSIVEAGTSARVAAFSGSSIFALTFGASGSGTVAIGGAFATNEIGGEVKAYLDNSSIDSQGIVQVEASASPFLQAITAAAAGSGKVGIVGAAAVNHITTHILANLRNDSSVEASGFVLVTATDLSFLQSLSATATGSGVFIANGAFSKNDIDTIIEANVSNSGVASSDRVFVTATAGGTIEALSAGVGGTGALAVSGGVTLNDIQASVDAALVSSAVSASGDIEILAEDLSTIRSLAGQGSGAVVGIGGAAAYNELGVTIQARIVGGSAASSAGNVEVTARSIGTIENIAVGGSLGVGAVGIAGSVSVNRMANTVEAFLNNAAVVADDNVSVLAESDNTLTVLTGALTIGVVGISGTVAVNTIENTTRAHVTNSTVATGSNAALVGVKKWHAETGAETVESARGLFVIATAAEAIDLKTATGGLGTVGIGGDVSVTRVSDTTEAYLRGSTINSAADFGQSVKVRAHQDTDIDALGGELTVGLAGIGAAVDTTIVRNTTRAFIDNLPTKSDPAARPSVIHARGVEVSTVTREDVDTFVAGIGGGVVSVAGAVSVVLVECVNEAFIQSSDVTSLGQVRVQADDTAVITADVGVAAVGAVGVGGSIIVTRIGNSTKGQILGGHVNATGALFVTADSDETIATRAGTAGATAFAAMAGAVSVNTIEATTEAFIGSGVRGSSAINQAAGYTVEDNRGTTQRVNVEVNDDASIDAKAGAFGVAALGGGVGASIDVSSIRNRTVASVGVGTYLDADGDVSILAIARRDLDSLTAAFGGGLFGGLAGAVSVLSLGKAIDVGGANEFASDLKNTVNDDLALDSPALNTNDAVPFQTAKDDVDLDLTDPSVNGALNTSLNTSTVKTEASIADAVNGGEAAHIHSGEDVVVTATHLYDLDVDAGAGVAGAVAVGGAVARVTSRNIVQAHAGNFSDVQAVGNVTIGASDRQIGDESSIDVFGGAIGIVGFGGAKATLIVETDTDARLGQNASLLSGGDVSITADHRANVDTDGLGLLIAAAAQGGTFTTSEVKGTVQALVGSGAQIGQPQKVGSLTVTANSDSTAEAFSMGGKGGVITGGFSEATATVRPTIRAKVENSADIGAVGDIGIHAAFQGDVNAEITGVNIGAIDIGGSTAEAELSPNVEALIGSSALTGRNIVVEAVADGQVVNASTQASSGSLIGAVGATALATAESDAEAGVSDGASLLADEAVIVRAAADNQADAFTDGLAIGVVGVVGRMQSTANARGEVLAHLDGDATAGSVTVDAAGIHRAVSFTNAASGGILVNGVSAKANTNVDPTVTSTIGIGSHVFAGNNVHVRADLRTDADATAKGKSGAALNVGDTTADVILTPTVDARIDDSAEISAFGSVHVLARNDAPLAIPDGGFNGTSEVDAATDRIAIPGHGLETGDSIIYQRNGNIALGGLRDGGAYNVLKVDDDTLSLGTVIDGTLVDPSSNTLFFSGPHHLQTGDRVIYQSNGNTPLAGLTDGQVLFIHAIDDRAIQLATSLANAQAGIAIDIATGLGKHFLRVDITVERAGTHQLRGVSGALGLLDGDLEVSNPDGIASAKTEGHSGAFIGFKGAESKVTVTPNVTAVADLGSRIQAGLDVSIRTLSVAKGSSLADNILAAVVGKGSGLADVTIEHNNTASLGQGATVEAGNNFVLSASSIHQATINADSAGKGVIDTAIADGTASLRHDTTARLALNSRVVAGNNARVESTSDTVANMTMFADGGRLQVASRANDDKPVSGEPSESQQRGILIGRNSDAALTLTDVDSGANIDARTVDLIAKVLRVQASGTCTSVAGIGIDQAVARIDVNDTSRIEIDGHVRGTDEINIRSRHENETTSAIASAGTLGAHAYNLQLTDSIVDTNSAGNMTTHDLFIEAFTANPSLTTVGTNETESRDPDRLITLDAAVVLLGGSSPELVIDENGNVIRAVNVSTSSTASAITVNDITNAAAGAIELKVNVLSGNTGVIDGSASTITVFDAFEKVTLINRSAKDLIVNDIDPINRAAMPTVTLDAQAVNVTFDVSHNFGPTDIEIQNLDPSSLSRILLHGLVNNPLGTTHLQTPGDIADGNGQGILRSNQLDIETSLGSVGLFSSPLRVELVQSAGRPTDLNVHSGDDINLRLQGRLRDTAAGAFVVTAGTLRAAEQLHVTLDDAVRETALPSLNYTVTVSEPRVPKTTTVKRHFRPPTGEANAILSVGALGTSPQIIAATYDFVLLEAPLNLDVSKGGGTGTVHIDARTNVTGIGSLTASSNGNITLRETDGDLTLDVVSSSGGNVTLIAVNGAIVEAFGDSTSDVNGVNLSFSSAAGIGAAGSPLDLNETGVVNVQAASDVFLNETVGNLTVGGILSLQGHVQLTAPNGSILESGNDAASDLSGFSLSLSASGSIGTSANDLEIDTGIGQGSQVNGGAGLGIFLTETAGGLNVQSMTTTTGDIRLTVNDAATAGQNLNLFPGGQISAQGVVTLQAGDNLDLGLGSSIAGASVILRGDHGNADAGTGSTVTIRGTITGNLIQVFGNADSDTITFVGWGGIASVNGDAGVDTLSLNLTGGTVTTLESMTLTGEVVANPSANTARINGSLNLGGNGRVFDVADGQAAQDLIVAATLTGGGLTKRGAGTMSLSANNSHTGQTLIEAGKLVVDGAQTASPVLVNSGTLAGRGTVGPLSGSQGIVSPGDGGPGRLNSGTVVLKPNSTFPVQLNGLQAGTQHDQLNVAGTVNLGGAVLEVAVGFASAVNNTYRIIDNNDTDAIIGTFAGLAEGATFLVGAQQFAISYKGGDGNDVVLRHVNTNAAFAGRTVTSPIDENGLAVLTGTPTDPDTLDRFILFVNWGDGTPRERHSFAPGTPLVRLEHRYLDSNPTAYRIDLQWVDQHGGGRGDSLVVSVANTAPALTLDGPTGGVRGQPRTFRFQASDDSPVDEAGEFSYSIDWGDGTNEVVSGGRSLKRNHNYSATGTYTVTATVRDKDGGVSDPVSRTVTISAVEMQGGDLAVGGTADDDIILIEPADAQGTLRVWINGFDQGLFRPTNSILNFGGSGQDIITINRRTIDGKVVFVERKAILDGEDGDDDLNARGNRAASILLGRDGADVLRGGRGRDVLIGGRGADRLHAAGAGDILLGASTIHDDNLAALDAILAQWSRPATTVDRIERGGFSVDLDPRKSALLGLASGLNGEFLLDGASRIKDGAIDTLFGDSDRDWLLGGKGDRVRGRGV